MNRIVRLRPLALAGIALLGCSPAADEGSDAGAAHTAPIQERAQAKTLVEIGAFERGEILSEIRISTDIEAEFRVEVYSKVGPAYIKEVLVKEGDAVTAGQPLLLLDDVDFQLEHRRRKAALEQRQQNEAQSAVALKEAEARYKAEQATFAKAKTDYERAKNAMTGDLDVLSAKELSDASSEFEMREAELEAVKLSIEKAKTDGELAALMTHSAQIELDAAAKDLRDTTVLAQITGVVQAKDVNPGLLVSSSTHLFTLVDPIHLISNLRIPQDDLRLLNGRELPVEFHCDAVPDRAFHGKVEAINPAVDPTSGLIKVRARLDDEAVGVLKPGMFASARIVTGSRKDAVLLPKRAVVHEGGREHFFAFEDGKARRLSFQPGSGTATQLEVLSVEGKVPDLATKIILVGQDRLRDGDPVERVTDQP